MKYSILLVAICNMLIIINLITMQIWLKGVLDKLYIMLRGLQETVKLKVYYEEM